MTATDPPVPDPTDEVLSIDAAARRLGLRPATLASMRHQGRGPAYVKHGRIVRYRASDIAAWLAAGVVEPGKRSV